jgi:hypothetical protein
MCSTRLAPENPFLGGQCCAFNFEAIIEVINIMKDLTGQLFGRLKVVSRIGNIRKEAAWLCNCECGKQKIVASYNLRKGFTQSCGCLHAERSSSIYKELNKTHGMTRTPTHVSWEQMQQRCNNSNHHAFKHYGGRGISICDRWKDFQMFLDDMGYRPEYHSLDRINVDGNYEPHNCRWASAKTQANNRRKKVRQ